jgi:hypothetical protein
VSEGIEERDGEGGLGRSTLPGWRERRLLSRSMLQSMADAAGIRSNSIDDDAADGGVVCLVCRAAPPPHGESERRRSILILRFSLPRSHGLRVFRRTIRTSQVYKKNNTLN